MNKIVKEKKLDFRWIELIKEAKVIGLTPEEIRVFLNKSQEDT